jgi:phenylacetate-coenzyme A ligase PaaK-like adenylate-forming protein
VTVENVYATSEAGGIAGTCPEGLGLHLNDDLVIVEPVDTPDNPPRSVSCRPRSI